MLRLNIEFKDGKKFDNLIRYIESNLIYSELQEEAINLADNTVNHMRDTISSSKKRHSLGNNLEKTIDKEILNTTGNIDIGIGNINKLKTDAPYYEVLDAGGYIPYSTVKGAPLGSFYGNPPVPGGSGENWERSGDKGYFMKPKKPIEGLDYINKAIRNLDKELKITMKKLGSKFISDMGKPHGWGMGAGGAK